MALDILVIRGMITLLAIAGVVVLVGAILAVVDIGLTRRQTWGRAVADRGTWYDGNVRTVTLLMAIGRMFTEDESIVVTTPLDRRVKALLRKHAERGRGISFLKNQFRLPVVSSAFQGLVQLAAQVPDHEFCIHLDVEVGTTILLASGDRPLKEDVFLNQTLALEQVRTFEEVTMTTVLESP